MSSDLERRWKPELWERRQAREWVRTPPPGEEFSAHGDASVRLERLLRALRVYDWGRRNYLNVRVVSHRVQLRRLPRAFAGLRILQISDVHADLDVALTPVVCQALAGLSYDYCVWTGDFRNSHGGPSQPCLNEVSRMLARVTAPSFAILGNHDFAEKVPHLEAMGIRVLINEAVPLQRGGARIWLGGVDDPDYFQTHDIAAVRSAIPSEECAVLLAHSPCVYREVQRAGFDLMLSGHTHGGQICLPGALPILRTGRCPLDLLNGPWNHRGMSGYTSPGTGASILPIRYFCPPEMTLHILQPAS